MIFQDRHEAGQKLAEQLFKYQNEKPFIIALPRGGVVIGVEVARKLKAPLDVMVVRKLGAPYQPELGIGAIAPNGVRILNMEMIRLLHITEAALEQITQKEMQELRRRLQVYRGDSPMPDLANRTVIIVDDGLATGITAKAAIHTIKGMNPKQIVLAAPVCAWDTVEVLEQEADEVVCVETPMDFMAVGAWYRQFRQVSDQEVIALLHQSRKQQTAQS